MRRFRSALLAVALLLGGLDVATAPSVQAAGVPAGTSKFVPAKAGRIVDTRPSAGAYGFTRLSPTLVRVQITGVRFVPANASAAVVNITATDGKAAGTITAYPAGSPVTAHYNVATDGANTTVANMATVKLGTGGAIYVSHTRDLHFTIDLLGWYQPVTRAVPDGRLELLRSPSVVVNHRRLAAGADIAVSLASAGVPSTASAALLLVTVDQAGVGFVTAYAAGRARPYMSNVSISTNRQSRSNQAIVPLTPGGRSVRLYTKGAATVTVAVVGWFTGGASATSTNGLFVPSTARRRLATKSASVKLAAFGSFTSEFSAGSTLPVTAVAANVYSTDSWNVERVIARPAGVAYPPVPVSTVGAPRSKVAAHALLRVSTRGVAVTSPAGSHLTVDIVGVYLGTAPIATLAPVKNRVVKPGSIKWVRWTEQLPGGPRVRTARVLIPRTDDLNPAADAGGGASYRSHSTLGAFGNVLVFGHRTSHGGVFNQLNTVPVGATFQLSSDPFQVHWYTYRVVGRHITAPSYRAIASMANLWPPITAQLVACSKANFLPTSTAYRLVVTGELIGYN